MSAHLMLSGKHPTSLLIPSKQPERQLPAGLKNMVGSYQQASPRCCLDKMQSINFFPVSAAVLHCNYSFNTKGGEKKKRIAES